MLHRSFIIEVSKRQMTRISSGGFLEYWRRLQVRQNKHDVIVYWVLTWSVMSCEIFTEKKRKEKKKETFIYFPRTCWGWGLRGGEGLEFAYSVSPLLNSKGVTKASLPCREVWYTFRWERHGMLHPDRSVAAKMYSCRAQILHSKAIVGESRAIEAMCLFLRCLNYSPFTLGRSSSLA